jgi:signal transduction histidine kinase
VTGKLKRDHQPARTALIIFVVLFLIGLAEIIWWIVFQVHTTRNEEEMFMAQAETRAALLTRVVNDDFQRLVTAVTLCRDRQEDGDVDPAVCLNPFLSDSALAGYVAYDANGRRVAAGHQESPFTAMVDTSCTLFFNQDYPGFLATLTDSILLFAAPSEIQINSNPWISADMFAINPEALARVKRQAHRRIIMFGSEGTFLIILTLIGAYLIYRTLYRAEELKYRQQNFIHAVTHELKAPVSSIRLYLETILAGKVDSEKRDSIYPKMIEDCDRLEMLIDNVLEAGHFSKAGYKLNLSPSNLSSDLNDYLEAATPLVERYHGRIERDVKEGLSARTDYQALRRAFTALIDNALKYSPAGKKKIVTVHASRQNTFNEIRIRNEGQGIAASEKEKIFERFYRVGDESTRVISGTGLGLFLVKEVIEAHKGKIFVESEGVNEGATFVVRLPFIADDEKTNPGR